MDLEQERVSGIVKKQCRTSTALQHTREKIEQVVGRTIMNKNSFSAVVVGFEEVDEVNGHFPMC